MIDRELLEILACPLCKETVTQPDEATLECVKCGRRYPVREGIPVMLVEEAALPGDAKKNRNK
ncbi:MAG: Trm112 family protein [Candidatus Omnitrophica bacterium]|nr:Trm112 family protein [Candidatus Omnitrophota bacterium]MBU4479194.1 Trm112 family protein [Candidatus Omnitrophota bacterium]MCG2704198.1 Trm112 family protein [Candidatus Omnitrophota bacterium]